MAAQSHEDADPVQGSRDDACYAIPDALPPSTSGGIYASTRRPGPSWKSGREDVNAGIEAKGIAHSVRGHGRAARKPSAGGETDSSRAISASTGSKTKRVQSQLLSFTDEDA